MLQIAQSLEEKPLEMAQKRNPMGGASFPSLYTGSRRGRHGVESSRLRRAPIWISRISQMGEQEAPDDQDGRAE